MIERGKKGEYRLSNGFRRLLSKYFNRLFKVSDDQSMIRTVIEKKEENVMSSRAHGEEDSLREDFVNNVYITLLGREPHSAESFLIKCGTERVLSFRDIVIAVLTSSEYVERRFPRGFSANSDDKVSVVGDIYRVLLGREADNNGLRHYSLELASLAQASAVVEAIIVSPEYKRRNARLAVRKTLEITFDVSQYLHANPDLRGMKMEALEHFIQHGVHEGRVAGPEAGHLDLTEDDWLEGSGKS